MNDTTLTPKLPFKVKLGYGVGGFGALMVWNNFILYAMYFFTDMIGFLPAFASTIIAVGTLWDAVTDPAIGYISDKRDPAKGRRRPFIKVFAIPLGLMSWLLFTNPGFSIGIAQIYFFVLVLAFYTFQTCIDVPLTALGAEMTQDYDERSKLGSMRSVFYVISLFISNAFLVFVAFFADNFGGGDWNVGYSYAGAMCGVLIIISLLISVNATKGYELKEVGEIKKFNLKELIIEPFKNKAFRYVAGLYAAAMAAMSLTATTCVYYFFNNLGWDENKLALFLIAVAVVGFPAIAIVNTTATKLSKKAAWSLIMIVWGSAMVLFPGLIWKNAGETTLTFVLFIIAMGFGTNLVYQMVWAMIPDCIEVDEFKNGKRREGMFYGITSLLQKIAAAVAISIAGWGLTIVNYDADKIVQTQETLDGLSNVYAFGTAAFILIALVIGLLNPMTRERHTALVEAIEAKKAGKEYSTEAFEKLL